MDTKDIAEKLTGQYAQVISKRWGEDTLVEREGTIMGIEPRLYLMMQHSTGLSGHIVFAGFGEGIFQIKNQEGVVIYQNDSVLEAYKFRFVKDETKQQELRTKGSFFLTKQ